MVSTGVGEDPVHVMVILPKKITEIHESDNCMELRFGSSGRDDRVA